jgi:hypothetical protein
VIYLLYPILAITSLIFTLLGLILAPVLPLFATQKEGWLDNHSFWGIGPRLPTWLNVFMTPDNSLDGDATFEKINGFSYLSKVKWLLRNPAYSFAIQYLQSPYTTEVLGDNTIRDNDNAKAGWCFIKANGLFQFVYIKRIFSTSRCIYVNIGWNIRALVDTNVTVEDTYQATFSFSPRISGFR